ncbi:cobalamin B12-binding domain-containing protein [Streptomyces sp. PKU-EA00015]|uniref:cobalamin B12-binding domain-containing protein n=1 Tax=Streptomyces sp. PKU-EA00015 TaxID=2748326 RepID=UPI0015A22C8D|nr:cobalamin-dependent protein [Streptomyces sp. PKU-EA00015]NWF27433.1 cobalamin B12-binding domain-containing protein [Streptomyces sp. PKU-EA00015]
MPAPVLPPSAPVRHARPARRVVVSSVSSDSHTWNLVFLQLLVEETGAEVANLGACVPDDLLLAECRRLRPDLVVISSVNGHGYLDGRRLITRLRAEADLADLPVVIGGKLGTQGPGDAALGTGLLAAGFDAVFDDSGGVEEFQRYLDNPRQLLPGRAAS